MGATSPQADEGGAAVGGESVEEAYLRLRPALVRLAYLVTGSVDLAEDAVHDAFVACGQRWSTLTTSDGYVRRAVVNHARSALRGPAASVTRPTAGATPPP
jgi:DNA-directed RNA polymerase specialized sigma24 family protein